MIVQILKFVKLPYYMYFQVRTLALADILFDKDFQRYLFTKTESIEVGLIGLNPGPFFYFHRYPRNNPL